MKRIVEATDCNEMIVIVYKYKYIISVNYVSSECSPMVAVCLQLLIH